MMEWKADKSNPVLDIQSSIDLFANSSKRIERVRFVYCTNCGREGVGDITKLSVPHLCRPCSEKLGSELSR